MNKVLRRRTVWLMIIIFALGFGTVICRLAYLQLIQGEDLKREASEQQRADTVLDAKRGNIYDSKGKILAQSASVWQVIMAPIYFENDEQRDYTATRLAEILKLKKEDILKETKEKTYYVNLKRKIETPEKEAIEKLQKELSDKYDLESVISLEDDYKRYYPYNDLASCVIGFAGDDGQGLSGVEYQYDEYLKGTPGRIISSKISDISGQINMPFEANQSIKAEDGNSLVLTIDENIQSVVEKYMKQGLKDNNVYNRGVCIILDVKTGEVLAMCTVNGYDLNDPFNIPKAEMAKIKAIDDEYLVKNEYIDENKTYTKAEKAKILETAKSEAESKYITDLWRNKAISDTYYPGSVFKMITLSMALQEKAVDQNTRVSCSGTFEVEDKKIDCTGSHGSQTYKDALINSCNPGFMQIGQLVGEDKWYEYYQGFGFSEKTGIDLPGESEDIFFSEDGFTSPVDLAVASFGQNFSITPIQMVTAISAIANGGYIVQPHVVKQILDAEGNIKQTISTDTKRQVISNDVAKEVRDILEENATTGSGTNGYVAGYRVGGKTGTSEKLVDLNDDGEQDYIASYGGLAPADDPKVACLVFFDTPTGGSYYGSEVSAPVFSNIMGEVLPYLEIDARYTSDESDFASSSVGSYTGLSVTDATNLAKEDGFEVAVWGDGKTVLAQSPLTGTTISSDGTITLFTDEKSAQEKVEVPSFIDNSVDEALYNAAINDLNVVISGQSSSSSRCIAQSVGEGEKITPGTVINLTFATPSAIND